MNDLHYRERKLKNMGLPQEYIDVYLYSITGNSQYLSEDYFSQYPTRKVINQSKVRKTKEELLLLFGRLIIFGELIHLG